MESRHTPALLALAAGALLAAAALLLAPSKPPGPKGEAPAVTVKNTPPEAPRSFAYLLQADAFSPSRPEAVKRLAASDRDWIILDRLYSVDGEGGAWVPAELTAIREGSSGRRLLAYISVGEAEDFRAYWRRDWDADKDGRPDSGAPGFLAAENPEWEGDYKVRYWEPEWQRIVLAEVDAAMTQGFDGVFLDIVDAFEYFEETGGRREYRAEMVDLVLSIAVRADSRVTAPMTRRAGALVVPQNGVQLLLDAEYMKAIDGVAVEDLYTDGDREQLLEHTTEVEALLNRTRKARIPVLLVEYPEGPGMRRLAQYNARRTGYPLLMTDRELTTLGDTSILGGRPFDR